MESCSIWPGLCDQRFVCLFDRKMFIRFSVSECRSILNFLSDNILRYAYTHISVFRHHLMGMWLVSTLCLLRAVLPEHFMWGGEDTFSVLDISQGVSLLSHSVTLFNVFNLLLLLLVCM